MNDPRELKFQLRSNMLEFSDELTYEVLRIGEDKNPILVADNVFKDPDRIRDFALSLRHEPEQSFYPGVVCEVPLYSDPLRYWITERIIRDAYGFEGDINLLELGERRLTRFSFSTLDLNQLAPDDRYPHQPAISPLESSGQPHVDSSESSWLAALVHLTQPDENAGGTAFWRHRATGMQSWLEFDPLALLRLEKLTGLRFFEKEVELMGEDHIFHEDAYESFYIPERRYPPHVAQSNDRWECIEYVPAKYNRLVAYPAWQFHSAVFDASLFKDIPYDARLTMNEFIPLFDLTTQYENTRY